VEQLGKLAPWLVWQKEVIAFHEDQAVVRLHTNSIRYGIAGRVVEGRRCDCGTVVSYTANCCYKPGSVECERGTSPRMRNRWVRHLIQLAAVIVEAVHRENCSDFAARKPIHSVNDGSYCGGLPTSRAASNANHVALSSLRDGLKRVLCELSYHLGGGLAMRRPRT
jgi:hypothetical protein